MTPKGETEAELREWWPVRFTLIVLMASAGVIALVWLGVWFPDQADHPGYWTAAALIVPVALLLVAASVWMVRKRQPAPPEVTHYPVRPTKGIAFVAAAWSALCLARGWTDLHATVGPREGAWSPLLDLLMGGLFLFGTIRLARVYVRREDWPIGARPPGRQWLLWLSPSYILAINIRSLESLAIAAGLTTLFAAALMIYFHAHRTPDGEPFRRSDSEMAR